MDPRLLKANALEEEIAQLTEFLELIKNGQKFNTTYNKQNCFEELTLKARICTGSDSPLYTRSLRIREMIDLFIEAGVDQLEILLKAKEIEFERIFK